MMRFTDKHINHSVMWIRFMEAAMKAKMSTDPETCVRHAATMADLACQEYEKRKVAEECED